jgi:hypothetical protein
MWLLFQTLIVCAVNFFLHVTPSPYLVGGTGALMAYLATWLVSHHVSRSSCSNLALRAAAKAARNSL